MTPGPATILVVDDEHLIRWSLEQQLRREGYGVLLAENGAEALQKAQGESPDLVLLDIRLPDADGLAILERLRDRAPDVLVIMITAHGGVESAVRAMKLGAYDYIVKPFDPEELKLTIKKALEARTLRREVARLYAQQREGAGLDAIVGQSRPLQEVKGLIQQIAQSDATTVLLEGESGTGKDLVARVIHFESARAQAPFLAVNCAALPEHLLESELLGHEKGAFTDAKAQKKGLFEQADGGTMYLDEIGDMRMNLQAKLLRLIEEKTFRRLGGVRDLKVDVRIVAATNRDLRKAMENGRVPQGPLLSAESVSGPPASPARAARRHPASGPAFPLPVRARLPQSDRRFHARGGAAPHDASVAGKRPGAAECRRASRHHGQGSADRGPGSAARDRGPRGAGWRGGSVCTSPLRADDARGGGAAPHRGGLGGDAGQSGAGSADARHHPGHPPLPHEEVRPGRGRAERRMRVGRRT